MTAREQVRAAIKQALESSELGGYGPADVISDAKEVICEFLSPGIVYNEAAYHLQAALITSEAHKALIQAEDLVAELDARRNM